MIHIYLFSECGNTEENYPNMEKSLQDTTRNDEEKCFHQNDESSDEDMPLTLLQTRLRQKQEDQESKSYSSHDEGLFDDSVKDPTFVPKGKPQKDHCLQLPVKRQQTSEKVGRKEQQLLISKRKNVLVVRIVLH